MDKIINFIKTDNFFIILVLINIILVFMMFINTIIIAKLKNKYEKFIKKIGNGNNIEEDLAQYMTKIEKVENVNKEIIKYCKNLDKEVQGCLQKVGIVRYSAFKDTGSDLSFALALLDVKNDGVILNGIYSREMSNIYAKPILNGKSDYILSKEEEEAIYKAINTDVKVK